MEKLLSISEAAKKLNVSPETLRRWDNSGKFRSSRHPINNYRVYSQDQIDNLMQEMQMELDFNPVKTPLSKYEPYFESNYGKLYKLDAVKMLKGLESNSIDLIFADPPYNIKKAEWDTFSNQKEYVDWCMEWITESHRVLKRTGSLYICGFSEILADLKWASSHLFEGCKWLVWFYRNKANLGKDWGRSHESILHFRMSKKFTFNIDEVRIPYNKHTVKYPKRTQAESSQYNNNSKKKYTWEPHPLGAKPKDVFEIPTISNSSWEKYPHVTQKPVELLRKIILSSSNKEDLIVDPFGGSGTTYAVAEAYERSWLGSELNGDYCQIIQDRVENENHISRIQDITHERKTNDLRKKLRG